MEEWPQDCLKEAAPDGGRTLQGSDSAPFAEDATSILGSSGEPAEAPNVYLESMAFNQDGSCFIAGTSEGFRVYTSSPLTEFVRREGSNWPDRGVHTAAMLFRTNVFATVSKLENRKVKFWDDSRRRFIGELRSRQPVKSVCLTRDVLAMVTDFAVYVYLSDQMRPINIIHTGSNERGLCALASGGILGCWLLACPAVAGGAVRVHGGSSSTAGAPDEASQGGTTAESGIANHVFQAHRTQLAALVFNSQGTLLATASEKGTVLRIFRASDGQLMQQLRRGTQISLISCIAIRSDDRFAAIASSETLHIFLLCSQQPDEGEHHHLFFGKQDETASDPPSRSGSSLSSLQLPAALHSGREITSAVYDASKEMVQDAIKESTLLRLLPLALHGASGVRLLGFSLQPHLGTAALPSELEGGHDGDQWQLVL
ncbi:wd g-beta repeat-containing protein [Cyclospora cayetanensis]|uniref:Wd g-beta repeat-containing protein n=1 Tax=Cyclospora cayetanensis TaxID=88456 RepID=A0A1D3CVB6_9EIME|nr:wd g-beta repeat-containing protein [Cyclospora cayetanensis]